MTQSSPLSLSLADMPDLQEVALHIGAGLGVEAVGAEHLVLAAEGLQPERLTAARVAARVAGPVLAITARRAATLKARAYDGDLARLRLPGDADLAWVQSVADPKDDLAAPMKGPLAALREGSAMAHRAALMLCKAARLLPAAVVTEVPNDALPSELTRLPAEAVAATLAGLPQMVPVVAARVPLSVSEAGRVHVFRPQDGGEEHYAVEIGLPDRAAPVLVRLHSACFTGDVLGSLKCDCGPQLTGALAQMGQEGAGVLLYLNQEGRGIGLANKMRAYSLQDQGFDTVEANHRLGFEDDERDFRLGAQILRRLGIARVRLMTNNPAKMEMLRMCGVEVAERVPLTRGRTPHNAAYLDTKAAKSGHLL